MTSLKDVVFNDKTVGQEIVANGFHMFFGNRYADIDLLMEIYPKYTFRFVKQVHGDNIIGSVESSESIEADGHFSSEKNAALCIRTADCLPVMLGNQNQVFSIHAGWRGVHNQIVNKALAKFECDDITLAIGPHIQSASFEVGMEVAENFDDTYHRPHQDKSKVYVDLVAALKGSLENTAIHIVTSGVDTFTDKNYYSYRRENGIPDRQVSFVTLI